MSGPRLSDQPSPNGVRALAVAALPFRQIHTPRGRLLALGVVAVAAIVVAPAIARTSGSNEATWVTPATTSTTFAPTTSTTFTPTTVASSTGVTAAPTPQPAATPDAPDARAAVGWTAAGGAAPGGTAGQSEPVGVARVYSSKPDGTVPSGAPPPPPDPGPLAELPPVPDLTRPIRVIVTGDSTAQALGTGVSLWAAANPSLAQVEVHAALGCGFLVAGERLNNDRLERIVACDDWIERLLFPAVERTQPDVVVTMVTTWDVLDHRWDDGRLLSPFDAEFRTRLATRYTTLVDSLIHIGAGRVVFVREPAPDVWWQPEVNDQEHPARHQVVYDLFEELAAQRPDDVSVIPLSDWFSSAGLDDDQEVRPDGIHLTPESATVVVDAYLGEQIVRAALGMETR